MFIEYIELHMFCVYLFYQHYRTCIFFTLRHKSLFTAMFSDFRTNYTNKKDDINYANIWWWNNNNKTIQTNFKCHRINKEKCVPKIHRKKTLKGDFSTDLHILSYLLVMQ